MNSVIVFLCTPRCGTQWFVKNLSEIYRDEVKSIHEPIKYEYYPKINLGKYDAAMSPTDNSTLKNHLGSIDEITKKKKYIEVGWQSIAGVQELYRRFGDRLQLIHLYRNPIFVAASLVTHNWYTEMDKERTEKAELTPFDEGAILDEYKSRWQNLNLFEKSLYYWTEINLRAIEIKYRFPELPYFSLKFENLFKKSTELSRITLLETLSFMGLDFKNQMLKSIDIKHDKHQYKTNADVNWQDLYKHPQTVALANKLGYRFDEKISLNRYNSPPVYKKILFKMKSYIFNN